jgi:hypothetical protein
MKNVRNCGSYLVYHRHKTIDYIAVELMNINKSIYGYTKTKFMSKFLCSLLN